MSNRSRFTDNPFRRSDLTPEQTAKLDARNRAIQIFYETGDREPAIEAGLFPPEKPAIEAAKPTKMIAYKEMKFPVSRTSVDSATIGLLCDKHEHDTFIVGIVEITGKWAVGRKETGGKAVPDNFDKAVTRCAELLFRECTAITEVDSFFDGDAVPRRKPIEESESDKSTTLPEGLL